MSYISLSEHDDVEMKTECSPYSLEYTARPVAAVDYTQSTNFDDPSAYFAKQDYNDAPRREAQLNAFKAFKIKKKEEKLRQTQEHIMHNTVANEQSVQSQAPQAKLLEEAVMQTLSGTADFDRLSISGDGLTADGLPHSTDFEKMVCGPAYGRPSGTPATMGHGADFGYSRLGHAPAGPQYWGSENKQMGFSFDLSSIGDSIEKGVQDSFDNVVSDASNSVECAISGKNCPPSKTSAPAPAPVVQTTQQRLASLGGGNIAMYAGIGLAGLAGIILIGKLVKKAV